MKKKILTRALLGAPIGLTICVLCTIVISLLIGDGTYYPVSPDLIAVCGSEINAVLLQTVFGMIYGALYDVSFVIWDMEDWSLLKMTVSHLAFCCAASFPIAWFMRWMPHSLPGTLCYFALFFVIYAVIWLAQYCAIRGQIRRMNSRLREKERDEAV